MRLFLVFLSLSLPGCGIVSEDEVARVTSPDGRVEAILVETNGGATTSFGYKVLVGERGRWFSTRQVAWLYGAGRNEHAYGANLRWHSDTELFVEYLEAREQELKERKAYVAGRNIEVVLKSGITDPAARAGGMLYNLRKR